MPYNNFLRLRKYKTHYFTKEDAVKLIEEEIVLNRKAAFQIGYDTGARAGEMNKIRMEHFDYKLGQFILYDSKKKQWKIVPLTEKTLRDVRMYITASKIKGKLFDVTTRTLNNWLSSACKRSGIKPDPGLRIRWHSWRGTFIRLHMHLGDQWLEQVTGDSYKTIQGYYSELSDEDIRRMKQEGKPLGEIEEGRKING